MIDALSNPVAQSDLSINLLWNYPDIVDLAVADAHCMITRFTGLTVANSSIKPDQGSIENR